VLVSYKEGQLVKAALIMPKAAADLSSGTRRHTHLWQPKQADVNARSKEMFGKIT
jgi:hypothetical protein